MTTADEKPEFGVSGREAMITSTEHETGTDRLAEVARRCAPNSAARPRARLPVPCRGHVPEAHRAVRLSSLHEVGAYFEAHYATFEADSRAIQAQFTQKFALDRVFQRWSELLFPHETGPVYPRPHKPPAPSDASRVRTADGPRDS